MLMQLHFFQLVEGDGAVCNILCFCADVCDQSVTVARLYAELLVRDGFEVIGPAHLIRSCENGKLCNCNECSLGNEEKLEIFDCLPSLV